MQRLDTDSFVGKRFGKWTVIKLHHVSHNETHNVRHYCFECACECGVISPVYLTNLRAGKSKGCPKCSVGSKQNRTKHPLYNTWASMIGRCFKRGYSNYQYYGGRGITVCKRWQGDKGFKNFIKDMGDKPQGKFKSGYPEYSIDRIDNSKGYSPKNCRWATMLEQAHNKRNPKRISKLNKGK